jgi:methanogenic corrinoid protein MtbC1
MIPPFSRKDIDIDSLALLTLEIHKARRPEVYRAYGEKVYDHCLRDMRYHFQFLMEAVSLEAPVLFESYVAWSNVLLNRFGITPSTFSEILDTMAEVASSMLPDRTGEQASQIAGRAASLVLSMPVEVPSFIIESEQMGGLASEYLGSIVNGDRQGAQAVIQRAVDEGGSIKDIYLRVFQPTQYEIGRLWQHRLISVAQEHYATAATQQSMAQLYPLIFIDRKRKGTVVVACVGDELHEVGARMVADFLELEGWGTTYLGANTPAASIAAIMEERGASYLFLSATMIFNVKNIIATIQEVRSRPQLSAAKVLVGGYPFKVDVDLWRRVGADGTATDAEGAIELIEEL